MTELLKIKRLTSRGVYVDKRITDLLGTEWVEIHYDKEKNEVIIRVHEVKRDEPA